MQTVLKQVYDLIDKEVVRLSKIKEFKKENEVAGNQLVILKMKIDNLKLLDEEQKQIIDFGSKMQLVRDVDFDGNIEFMFNPENAFIQMFKKD